MSTNKGDMFEWGLMEKEIDLFNQFTKDHPCDLKVVSALIEECCAPSLYKIILNMSSIGMYPTAKCLACGTEKSISCKERIESV